MLVILLGIEYIQCCTMQATLCKDHNDDVYQVFLDTLLKAKREKWKSEQVKAAAVVVISK